MGIVELKSNLHLLIDEIQNPKLLESLHEILTERQKAKDGNLWNGLSSEQKDEVLEAYEESENLSNLIPHSEVVKNFK